MNGVRRSWLRPRSAVFDSFRLEPNREVALACHACLAERYEVTTTRIREVRRRAVDLLELLPGQTVFDVACGAGATLADLAWRVGSRGHVIRIARSHEMAALGAAASGDANMQIFCDSVQSFRAPQAADALAFCYTRHVQQSPQALNNLFAQARPEARVAVAGLCLLPWWSAPANAGMLWGARDCLTMWRGPRKSWSLRATWCPDLHIVNRHHLGTSYLVSGTVSKA